MPYICRSSIRNPRCKSKEHMLVTLLLSLRAPQFYPDSRLSSANQFLRYRKSSPPYLFDKQLCLASVDNCSAVQTSLADRVVLQMDQTKSSNQSVLWYFPKRRENPNLDRSLFLFVGCNHQEAAANRTNTQRNSSSVKHHAF